jgi:hypothetical protein
LKDSTAWAIVRDFALSNNVSLPQTEERLQNHLGNHYAYSDWKAAFDAILQAEDNIQAATATIDKLETEAIHQHNPPSASFPAHASSTQLQKLETELMQSITELKARKHIVGEVPTLEELLNPNGEDEIGDLPY